MSQSFPKSEKLTHKRHIDELFDKNNSANVSKTCFPFRIIANKTNVPVNSWPKVLISVSKRNFKRAVDRNLLKRKTRETYRLNKIDIADQKYQHLAFIYIARNIETTEVIEKGMKKALRFLIENS